MILNNFGFTQNWRESFWRYTVKGTKRIKLAVVGANSHGKSYLLVDIVHAFEQLGFTAEQLPLSFPYSSLAGYFKDISNVDGCVRGTSRYACRHENHYGAVLRNEMKGVTLDIEFLNIPGEAFKAGMSSVSAFGSLKRALEQTGKIFTVTTWRSRSGEEEYVVEPNAEIRKALNLPTPNDNDPAAKTVDAAAYHNDYQEWPDTFRRLRDRLMSPDESTRKAISGRTLVKNFFKYQPDSMLMSIYEAWPSMPMNNVGLTAREFKDKQYIKDFYFHMYCLEATDIVLCDKLFYPENGKASQSELEGAKGYVEFTQQLVDFLMGTYRQNCRPNLYLAFRGADRLLDEPKVIELSRQLKQLKAYDLNNAIYSAFLHGLLKQIDAKGTYQFPADKLKTWLGINADPSTLTLDIVRKDADLRTLTDTPLPLHVESRMGGMASGFWRLLMSISRGNKAQKIFNLKSLPIAPHVFFTSTPIDSNYHIYQCDGSKDNQRFVRQNPDTNQVEALNVVGLYLSFGTTQLCIDMLRQNGVKPIAFNAGTLLNRVFAPIK